LADDGLKWADEELRGMEVSHPGRLRSRFGFLGKLVLAFWDEALILLILAYLVYRRFFTE
jgi:hypothetical protein